MPRPYLQLHLLIFILAMLFFGEHRELHPSLYLGALTIVAANILYVALKRSHS